MPEAIPQAAHILDTLQAGAAIIDRAGTILHVNPPLCAIVGHDAERLVGRSATVFFPEAEHEQRLKDLRDNFDAPLERETPVQRADGQTVNLLIAGRRMGDQPPWSDYRVLTILDITAMTQAYAQIAQLSDTVIAQALELKGSNTVLEQRVKERTVELRQAYLESIYMLAVASEGRDADTGRHIRRIETYSREIAEGLGIEQRDADRIGYSSVLHDVGKLHIPDSILKKPGPLDTEERAYMQKHTIFGETILSDATFFDTARGIARSHHENFDGTGYPDAIGGDEIPLAARIVRVADVFDALSSRRIYKDAWSVKDAVNEIRHRAGTLFDPDVARVFCEMHDTGKLNEIRDRIVRETGEPGTTDE